MKNYVFESLEESYPVLIKDLINEGDKVSPRGIPTREISPVCITIKDPRKRFIPSNVRRLNVGFAIAEMLWILRCSNSATEIGHYNKNWLNFSDDGTTLNGAYGKRIFAYPCKNSEINQFEEAYKLLKEDTNSRQATIVLFNPELDYIGKTKDKPCTNLLRFKIRNNKLIMTTYMRSNDINLGLCYDVVNFTILQELMAGLLGLEMGEYIHIVDSFHMYERDIDFMSDVANEEIESLYEKTGTFDGRIFDIKELKNTLEIVQNIEKLTRENKEANLDFVNNEIKKIKNKVWRSYAAIIAVYNFRKYRRTQEELDKLKENITNEYVQVMKERYNQLF